MKVLLFIFASALFLKQYMLKKLFYGLLKKLKFLPQHLYVKIYYEYYTGKKLNLEDPKEFNEKVQWLKVHYRPKILNKLVNKYEVREYVREKIGPEYLNNLLAVYRNASAVDLDTLPDRFVLKAAHGYGFNLIVPQKSKLNSGKARYLFHKWFLRNQYYRGGLEWAYKDSTPYIVAEEFLEEPGKNVLDDYKIYCFGGKAKFVQVDRDRGGDHHKYFFDRQWCLMPFSKGVGKVSREAIAPPENWEKMFELAEKLADKFPFVRVDFYNLSGRIIFGEMTFYPGDGRQEFYPDIYNRIIGDYLELPDLGDREYIKQYG